MFRRSPPNLIGRIGFAVLAISGWLAGGVAAFAQPELSSASLRDLIGPYLSPADAPQLKETERRIVELAELGKLRSDELAEASLIVEGSDAATWLAKLRERMEEWNRDLAKGNAGQSAKEKAAAILQFLHVKVLTGGYEAHTSSLVATLKEGRYNCVSASLLFLALAEKQGISAAGVQRPGHVFCRVQSENGEWLDVETTCAKCGVPAHRGEIAGARQVTSAEFLAKCYYNLGVIHLQAHRFHDAVGCCALAWQLDPRDDRARDNLLASLNNGALSRCDLGDFGGAEALLARARRIAPEFGPLVANEAYLARLRVARLCGEERYQEALAVVAELKARRPASAAANALEGQIRRQFAARERSLPGNDGSGVSPEVRAPATSGGDLTLPGF